MAAAVSRDNRPFQVVVWGATGYTGRLMCEQIAAEYPGAFRWGMAGRSRGKLEALRADLEKIDARCKDVPLIIADAADQTSIDSMVGQTDVIAACAGPFFLYGEGVVDACVRLGTQYCDITGETPWVRDLIRKYHDAAVAKGVRIVPFCGQDSVPSDLGTWFVVDHIKKKLNRKCDKVDAVLMRMEGGFSGGTISTAIKMTEQRTPSEMAKLLADPYHLDPPDGRRGSDGPDALMPVYHKELRVWCGPFPMAPVNTRVVRRSNALLGHAYGDDFKYSELWNRHNWLGAFLTTLVIVSIVLVVRFKFLQQLFGWFIPKPGEGPSEEDQRKGHWKYYMVGLTQEEPGVKPKVVKAKVADPHEPYVSTARMVLESALCLALEPDNLKKAGTLEGGVLTPATAMGPVLLHRLRKKGFTFEILESGAST
ncbi:unnamed protein product [Ostreobium quekettii]|uniref:Saccharopine dehydrogenase NADP binding domain-containing protein n=1 Tax=Ostreobium quekettii TaxID=121088 RepID=A0A8S1IRG3_9CHLO|nr:unnamed protein product [Ostreobium quekettii]